MRVWEGHAVLNLLRAGEDVGWVVAMIVIGFTTFVVSSIVVSDPRKFREEGQESPKFGHKCPLLP